MGQSSGALDPEVAKKKAAQKKADDEKKRLQEQEEQERIYLRMRANRAMFVKLNSSIPTWIPTSPTKAAERQAELAKAGTNLMIGGEPGTPSVDMLKKNMTYRELGSNRSSMLHIDNNGVYRAIGGNFEERWETIVRALAGQGYDTVTVAWQSNNNLSFKEVSQMMAICEKYQTAIGWEDGDEFDQFLKGKFKEQSRNKEFYGKHSTENFTQYEELIARRDAMKQNAVRGQFLNSYSSGNVDKYNKAIPDATFVKITDPTNKKELEALKNGQIGIHKTPGAPAAPGVAAGQDTYTAYFKDGTKVELGNNANAASFITNNMLPDNDRDTLYQACLQKKPVDILTVQKLPSPDTAKENTIYFYKLIDGTLSAKIKEGDSFVSIPLDGLDNRVKDRVIANINDHTSIIAGDLTTIQTFLTRTVANLDIHQNEVASIKERLDKLNAMIEDVKEGIDSRNKIINNPDEIAKNLETARQLDKKGKAVKSKTDDFEKQLDEFINNTDTDKNKRNDLLSKFTAEKTALEARCTALQTKLTALNGNFEDNTPAKKAVKKMKADLTVMQDQFQPNEGVTKNLTELDTANTQLNAGVTNLKAQNVRKGITDAHETKKRQAP